MRKNGFSLIELLVVIAIISILAAILMPIMLSAKKAGQTAACLSNMGQIAKAVIMYADDNNTKCVPCTGFPPAHQRPLTWRWLVRPYLGKNEKVWVCPAAPKEIARVYGNDVPASYGLNYNLFAAQGPNEWGFYPAWSFNYANPSRLLMLIHSKGWTSVHCMMLTAAERKKWIPYPHNNMNAIAFLDGHVKAIKVKKTIGTKPSEFMWMEETVWSQPGAWHDTSKTWAETCQGWIDDILQNYPPNDEGD